MPLDRYREKRDFARTPEPDGGAAAPADAPRFVIQKHAASRLHYDFRLEMEGVLRSWAVPKGPSLDTTEKHLAVEVEDHPIEYGSFEGTIPAGEYGGGTVMVWDQGTYTPRGDAVEMYRAGNLKVDLHGHKLEGGFALVRMKRRPKETKDNWLLIKERDAHVRPHAEYDVLAALPALGQDRSQHGGDRCRRCRDARRGGRRRPVTSARRAQRADTRDDRSGACDEGRARAGGRGVAPRDQARRLPRARAHRRRRRALLHPQRHRLDEAFRCARGAGARARPRAAPGSTAR